MNIILIGMPGCGKSTVGVLLAKTLLLDFIDTDIVIQNKFKKALCDIINEHGNDYFKQSENEIISGLSFSNSVIATGGSAVYGKDAMSYLKSKGTVIYLKLPIEEITSRIKNIKTRGIVMQNGATISDLYSERLPLYEKYADITIDCAGLTAEECVSKIIDSIYKK